MLPTSSRPNARIVPNHDAARKGTFQIVRKSWVVALTLGALLGGQAHAALMNSTWTNGAGGNWNVGGNWSTNPAFPNNGQPIPTDTYDAIIALAGAYTVTLNTNTTIENLTLNAANATINHTANTFSTTGAINLQAGTYSLAGGTIANSTINATVPLQLTANGSNLLSGVTVNGDMRFNADSARTKIAGGATFTTAHLANANAGVGFVPGQTLSGTILFDGAAAGTRNVEMDGTAGAFIIGATGVIRSETGLGGNGQIGATFWYGGAMSLTNQGLISSQVSGRTITVNPSSFTNSNTLQASGGGILTIAPTNPWTNGGTISVTNATVNLGGTFNATGGIGTFSNTAGTVNITGTMNNAGNTATFNNATGSWNLLGGTISGGALAFPDNQTLVIAANSLNRLSGVTVNGDLRFNADSARTKIAGGATFTTAHLANANAGVGFVPGQTLSGTILFDGAAAGTRAVEMDGTAGAFTIGATGVIRSETGLGGNGQIGATFWYGGAMTLTNQGLISSQVSSRTITVNPSSFTNSNTLQASGGGILSVPAGYVQSAGATRLNSGALLATGGGSLIDIQGGSLEGQGTVTGNVRIGGTLSPGLSIGTITINGNVTLNGTMAAEVSGANIDRLTVNGGLTLGGSSVLDIQGFLTAANYVIANYNAGSLAGTFGNVLDATNQGYSVMYGNTQISLV